MSLPGGVVTQGRTAGGKNTKAGIVMSAYLQEDHSAIVNVHPPLVSAYGSAVFMVIHIRLHGYLHKNTRQRVNRLES